MRMQQTNSPSQEYDRKPKKKRRPIGFFILFIILIVLIGFGIYFANIVGELNHNDLDNNNLGITSNNDVLPNDNLNDTSITNIALFGVDKRDDQTQVHSDAIIIMSIDKKHNKIKLSSLMRDTLIDIEGVGANKLTQAYFDGGPQLAVKTINQNFNLLIKEYATVDFRQMATIIDAIGGIEIDISESERLDANNSIYEQAVIAGLPKDIIKVKGKQTLNGTQAVAYARIRHVQTSDGTNDDFGRTDRQREVLGQMFYKALSMSPIQYPEFARKMLPAVETSLDIGEILGLATIMLRDVIFEEVRFPLSSDLIGNGITYVGKMQCINADITATSEKLHSFIYDDIMPEVK